MMTRRRVLLVEPGYPNKYPPLGLMKLAAYHGESGRGDVVRFVKGQDSRVFDEVWDRVYVTTLFSFEWRRTAAAIDFAIEAAGGQRERVFVGGIAASLMHEEYLSEPRWVGVRFIKGLLDGPPAMALQLSRADCDFGAGDMAGTPVEHLVPDYGILEQIEYQYPVRDAYFGYASRGCVRKCSFCGVPKLEGAQRDMPSLIELVEGIRKTHGEKKDLILMDNNVTASPRYREVIAEIRDLGFTPGAKIKRPGENQSVRRRVDFNQGVDARILSKSPMYLREMATICISPLRIAFDHLGLRRVYEKSIRMAADNGITSLSNYMLYNFMDKPSDLYARLRINIDLNVELGIRIWSFPMRYQPVTLKDRSHVGRHWNRYFLRSFQIILQATRGIVSGTPSFFARAFGEDPEEFGYLLSLPQAFIFFREYYESGPGKGVREEYERLRSRMSRAQEQELIELLGGPAGASTLQRSHYAALAKDRTVDSLVRRAIRFHVMDTKEGAKVEGNRVLEELAGAREGFRIPTEEEIVEDAGLYEDDSAPVGGVTKTLTIVRNGRI